MKIVSSYVLIITLIISTIPQSANAGYPLSTESKSFIAKCAIIGGVIGGIIGLGVAADDMSKKQSVEEKEPLSDLHRFGNATAAALTFATIGALIGGFGSYFFTNESYLSSAENDLQSLEHDLLFKTAINPEVNTSALKKLNIYERFPALVTCNKLEALHRTIIKVKDYLLTVMRSKTSALVTIAQSLLARLEQYEEKVVAKLVQIKNDAQYLHEVVIQKKIQHLENIAFAQAQMAREQRRIANALWHKQFEPKPYFPPIYYVKPK